jgi:hypothetical protein
MPVNGKHLLHYVPHGINSSVFKPLDKSDILISKMKKRNAVKNEVWLNRESINNKVYWNQIKK